MRTLNGSGAVPSCRVGATDRERAVRVAQAAGATADVDTADPMAGLAGLASGTDASAGVNRGAVLGGVIGAIAGLAGGATPLGAVMPVEASLRTPAATLLFFAIGVAVGGVWGGAFGRRPSTHAGFRLIDAMEDGDLALLGVVASGEEGAIRKALEDAGASDILFITPR